MDLTNATSPPHPFLAGNSPEPSGILRAPPGSEVVTPLTELLVQMHGPRPTPTQIKAFSARVGLDDRLITQTDPFAPSLMAENPQLAAGLQAAARRVTEMIRANRDSSDNRPDNRPDNPAGDQTTPEQMLREAEKVVQRRHEPEIAVTVEQHDHRIHENFPTSKSVFTAPEGYVLVEGYGDNHLFRPDDDGRLFFRDMPDFEAPGDLDRNNVYQLRLSKTAANGDLSFINLSVSVVDLRHELYSSRPIGRNSGEDEAFVEENVKPTLGFSQSDIFGQGQSVPGALTKYLLSGVAWRMPDQGPLVLTWSLVTESNKRQREAEEVSQQRNQDLSGYFAGTQAQIDQARRYIEAVLAEFERAANVRFVEVEHSRNNRGDVPITYLFLPEGYSHIDGTPGAWAGYPGALARFVQLFKPWEPYTYYRGEPVHEIGHVMGLRHPFSPQGQGQTSWPSRPELKSDFGTIMSYARKPVWVGLADADIAVLQFLYGAPQGAGAGTQRPGIETILGETILGARADDRRPPAEQVIDRNEALPDPPKFRGDASVMTVRGTKYSFTADADPAESSADLEVHYFIVQSGNQEDTFEVYGFPEPVLTLPFSVERTSGDVSFNTSYLHAGRLLHKQQLVAVAMDPDKPALWSQSFKTLFAYWPTIDALLTPSRNLLNFLGIVFDKDSDAERLEKHAMARAIIERLFRKEEIRDDAPTSQKVADLSDLSNAKLIWKGTGSQFLQGVDPDVDAEIFPILNDAQFFEIRADGGIYVRDATPNYGPLDHQALKDLNRDNKYDLFIEYGDAGARKHVAFRITVTEEVFDEADADVMSQMVVSMDVM